jgi:hypothetical protein
MNRQENNKMIAEFMGYENVGTLNNPMYDYYDNYFQDGSYVPHELCYHKSWDWLMPVVNKIEEYLSANVGKVGYFDECLSSNDLDIRYNAVVEFINQYNKNESTD